MTALAITLVVIAVLVVLTAVFARRDADPPRVRRGDALRRRREERDPL